MSDFLQIYDNRSIEDWGSGKSDDFKAFAKKFRTYINEALQNTNVTLDKYNVGHYDVSGFFKRGNDYVYFSYSVPRGEQPININARDYMFGVLIRKAKSSSDYTGGINHFCSLSNFIDGVYNMFEGDRV